jgi:hypothetical protein
MDTGMTDTGTDFEIPNVRTIAVAALEQLRTYASHVVFHGTDGSLALAVSEREAEEIADPSNDDSFFAIADVIAALSFDAPN